MFEHASLFVGVSCSVTDTKKAHYMTCKFIISDAQKSDPNAKLGKLIFKVTSVYGGSAAEGFI